MELGSRNTLTSSAMRGLFSLVLKIQGLFDCIPGTPVLKTNGSGFTSIDHTKAIKIYRMLTMLVTYCQHWALFDFFSGEKMRKDFSFGLLTCEKRGMMYSVKKPGA